MIDFSWLSEEARHIHHIFENLFFAFILLLLLIGVVLEYFKFSVGSLPSFLTLVGRSLVASIMLIAFPDILNMISEVVDAVANQIGDLNQFKLVLARMGDKVDELSWNWASIKQMTIIALSFLTFFVLYISVYISEAIYLYSWTLLYIFSPVLIALYVLPQTAGATKALFSSIFQVASWKILWVVLATLLWSSALMDLDKLGESADFLTIILFNIMLAASLVLTPLIGSALLKGGIASTASKLGSMSVGAGMYAAAQATRNPAAQGMEQKIKSGPAAALKNIKSAYRTHKDSSAIKRNPGLKQTPHELPSARHEQAQENKALQKMDKEIIKSSPYRRYMPQSLPSHTRKKK